MTVSSAARGWLPIVLVALLAGCGKGEPTGLPTAASPPAVTVVRAVMEDVTPTQSFTGRIQAMDKVDLRTRVQGFLEKRLFQEGADVKEGDLLFVIEKPPYETAVADAKGAIERAQGALKLAEVEVDRFRELVKKQAAAQNDLDLRVAKHTEARGALMQSQAGLEKAELDLATPTSRPRCRDASARPPTRWGASSAPRASRSRPWSVRTRPTSSSPSAIG